MSRGVSAEPLRRLLCDAKSLDALAQGWCRSREQGMLIPV